MNRGAVLAVLALGVLLTLGAVAPGIAPVVLTSPDSASMTPTAEPHSLVIVLDSDPSVGEIALFETPTRNAPVLHRLVGTTEGGDAFLTQGDANDFTDQEAGDPPIPASDVYGTVPTIAGHPLVVPYAGIVLTNPVVGFGIWALLGASLLYTTTGGRRVRETVAGAPVRLHVVAIAIAVLVLLPVVSLGTAATVHTEILTTTTAPEETPYLVQPGEAGERTIRVSSPVGWGIETTTQIDGALRIESIERSPESGSQLVTVVNDPRPTPGVQSGSVTVYSYPAVLPQSVLSDLANVHPLLAGFASAVPIAGGMILLAFALFDPKLPLRASRNAIQRRRRTDTNRHVD
jgi:signal peptidase